VKRRIIQKLLRLYPPQWRDEYGTELEDLLLAEPLQPAVVMNVIANALRQQVRISNHPPSAVRFLAFVLRVSFAFGALLCGLRAMGYWVILQVGGVPPAESGGIALVVYRSVFWFVILSSASAYLRERTKGVSAIVVKALYLIGAYGLPPIALFTVVSKGAVLKMPEVMSLLVLLVCFVLVFRESSPKHNA
jgi:hypothetical protein